MTDQAPELLPSHRELLAAILLTAWTAGESPLQIIDRLYATRPTPAERPVPDYETAARALGFQQMPSGQWWAPNPLWHVTYMAHWDSAEAIFDWLWNAAPAERPVPQVREALKEIVRESDIERSGPWDAMQDRLSKIKRIALVALTARPSDAAVAWRVDLADWLEIAPRSAMSFGDERREVVKPTYLLARDVDRLIELLRVVPHEEAVREAPDIFAIVYKIVDAQLAQSAPGIAELIRGGIARAIAMKAKAALSPTVASERVSERETLSPSKAQEVIDSDPSTWQYDTTGKYTGGW